MPGGLLTTTSIVENYPGFPDGVDGFDLMQKMQKQAERFGARIQFANVEAVDVSNSPFKLKVDDKEVETQTLIIASGAGHRKLGFRKRRETREQGGDLLRDVRRRAPDVSKQTACGCGRRRLGLRRGLFISLDSRRRSISCIVETNCARPRSWRNALSRMRRSSRSGIRS